MKEIDKLRKVAEPHGITVEADHSRGSPKFILTKGTVQVKFRNTRYLDLEVRAGHQLDLHVPLTYEEAGRVRHASKRTNLTLFEGVLHLLNDPLEAATRAEKNLADVYEAKAKDLKLLTAKLNKAKRLRAQLEKERESTDTAPPRDQHAAGE